MSVGDVHAFLSRSSPTPQNDDAHSAMIHGFASLLSVPITKDRKKLEDIYFNVENQVLAVNSRAYAGGEQQWEHRDRWEHHHQ